jgi:hypothetical protein
LEWLCSRPRPRSRPVTSSSFDARFLIWSGKPPSSRLTIPSLRSFRLPAYCPSRACSAGRLATSNSPPQRVSSIHPHCPTNISSTFSAALSESLPPPLWCSVWDLGWTRLRRLPTCRATSLSVTVDRIHTTRSFPESSIFNLVVDPTAHGLVSI